MIIRRKNTKKLMEDVISAEDATTGSENTSSTDVLEIENLSEEEKKKKALEELDKKDDAEIMSYILSGKMPEDESLREKIFSRGNDYIQRQMTGAITPDKQKEIYNKIIAGAGLNID